MKSARNEQWQGVRDHGRRNPVAGLLRRTEGFDRGCEAMEVVRRPKLLALDNP
jgi:hypothetical protein